MSERISRRSFLGTTIGSSLLSSCGGIKIKPCPVAQPAPLVLSCRRGYEFQNWAQTLVCRPSSYCQPHDTGEVAAIVKAAVAAGRNVRTVGAGHSFSPLVLTPDVLVNLDNMQAVIGDPDGQRVTVQAGIRLKTLILELRKRGLALPNIGSITEQSIAGVVSTATHGTGLPFGCLSTRVAAMKIVTGSGETLSVEGGDLLRAARVSLGALGIVTEVTLDCVPDHQVEAIRYWCHFDDIVDQLLPLADENERLLLWWLVWPLGCRHEVVVTTMNKPGTPRGRLGKLEERGRVVREPLKMDTRALLKHRPTGSEPPCSMFERSTGDYEKILTIPLVPVYHRECEYALPIARTAEALRGLKRFFDSRDAALLMPVEVRFVKQDDAFLSPAWEGNVTYIGVSTRPDEGSTEINDPVEALMRSLGGRPHWGKVHNMTAQETEALYAGYGQFKKIKQELDPAGAFANEHIRQLFGA